MRAPEKWSPVIYCPDTPQQTPTAPTVHPTDDHVEEGLLGPDGKPLTAGTRRKNPIGFSRGQQ